MKLSISLSDALDQPLKAAIKDLGTPSVSLVMEAALAAFLSLDHEKQSELLMIRQADRSATSREGWIRSFWQLLGLEMGVEDRQENELAPRWHQHHIVVILMPAGDRYPTNDDDVIVHASPKEAGYMGHSTWTFERGVAPSSAARAVGEWLRIQSTLEKLQREA